MLDFDKIIAGVAGQRETFEELVCQILRRLPPATDAEFRRIHGSGGDGGVEAVWVLADGTEHGVQAKYYTKAAAIDWAAIDKSVTTALATHSKLTKMHIAIACPLTGQTLRKTKTGKPTVTAWDQWETHKAKWEVEAAALGRSVFFTVWSAADLEDLLASPSMAGMIDYWFGGIELSPAWLKAQADRTIAALEERYHPEDHVNASIREVFDGLLRTEKFRTALLSARAHMLAETDLGRVPTNFPAAATEKLGELSAAVAVLRAETAVLEAADWSPWPFAAWVEQCGTLTRSIFDAVELAREHRDAMRATTKARKGPPNQPQDQDTVLANYVVDALSKLRGALGTFDELLIEPSRDAAEKRFVYLDGRAGSGKSHLIASEVERMLEAGMPALFLIGTDFTQHGTIEQQMLGRLDISSSKFDALLGALNARAEAEGVRALIAIDAINEGAGAPLWRPALQALAKRILAFPRLTFCVSCRREYTPQLLTDATREMAAVVDVRGFDTEEEMERAARVYMDRRGIVRPGTPWLSPEFSNPLFLRTTCLALEREGRTEFPRGMRGTGEVLAFFLESTARHLGTDYDGSNALIGPTRQALLDLAADMAAQRHDYVAFGAAHTIVEIAFRGFAPPPGKTWVEILRFRGLLRVDPNPGLDAADPFAMLPDVIRFSFQRFQDHLIAHALLRDAMAPTGLFDPGAQLAFLLHGDGVHWEWRGVFYALWVHVADRFDIELVDCLPGSADAWWDGWEIEDAFIESVRWRSTSAFTDRTRALLNATRRNIEDVIQLLIELAVVTDHPWNAVFLHRNLLARPLAKRDAFWTLAINHAFDDISHPAVRLIDWASNADIAAADDRVLGLASTMLGWFCTATSGELRDRATKALTSIFVVRPALVDHVFADFATCDDLYVVERLTAALYGAALRSTDPEPLRAFGRVAWSRVFADAPPLSMLARDYARGVIELAVAARVLDAEVDLARCRPPYGATAPKFALSADKVDARAARLGAESITRSCYKGLADFGRYTVEHRVERFANAPLDGPRPETAKESWKRFKQDFSGRPDILFAVEQVRQAYRDRTITFDPNTFSTLSSKEDNQRIADTEMALFAMLTPEEEKRYRNEVSPWASGLGQGVWTVPGQRGKGKPIDSLKAKVWIANRAMSLGWTSKLFPRDRSWGEDRVRGSRTERIGKKYQRIAFGELLARLADTNWLAPDYGTPAVRYDSPIQVEFVRDIEPSILPADLAAMVPAGVPNIALLQSADLPTEERDNWVREPGLAEKALSLATGSDLGSADWLALYRYASCDIDLGSEEKTLDVPWQQSEFYFASLLLLPNAGRDGFLSETQAQADDFHEWLPGGNVDGPFLRELGRRDTWPGDPWSVLRPRSLSKRKYRAIRGSVSYQWESHLDGSLPDGAQYHLPAPWIVTQLGLRFAPGLLGLLVDATGTPTAFVGTEAHSSFAFIRRDALMRLAVANELTPILTVIGERMAITRPGVRSSATRVRYNGTLWLDNGKPRMKSWSTFD